LAGPYRWFEGLYCLELPSQQSVSLVELLDPKEEGAIIPGNVGNFFFQSTRHNIPEDSVLQLHCSENDKSRTIENFLTLQEETN